MTGEEESTATFVSDGREAFVVEDGERTTLPAHTLAALRAPDAEPEDVDGALGTLALGEWVTDPRREGDSVVGGVEVERFDGGVDVPRALTDLAALATGLGATETPLAELGREDRARVEAAVEGARMVLFVGKDDGIPRRLDLRIDLSAQDRPALREALGGLGAVRLNVHFVLEDVNRPVGVDADAD